MSHHDLVVAPTGILGSHFSVSGGVNPIQRNATITQKSLILIDFGKYKMGVRWDARASNRIGGKLYLWTRPGSGTEVELKVPAATAYRSRRANSKDSDTRVSAAR